MTAKENEYDKMIRFSIKENLNDREIELLNQQKLILTKMENNGFGVKVAEEMYLPIPSFLTEDNFPIEICQGGTNTIICFENWEELEEYFKAV